MSASIYELRKENIVKVVNSEKKACDFIGVKKGSVARANCDKRKCKGWEIKRIGITTHGMSRTNNRIYKIWCAMKERCCRVNHTHYNSYGGRGISVCEEWITDFLNFYNWSLNNGYSETLTIDRINNDGNYEPNNCRWVTVKKQQNNKRNNHYIFINGKKMTATECAEMYKKPISTIIYWDKKGVLLQKLNGSKMDKE